MKPALYNAEKIRCVSAEGATLLNVADLSIDSGEFIILGGPNGSGKTLLIRSLLGLITHSENRIIYNGNIVKGPLSQNRDRVSYVPQHPENYILGVTVKEDLLFSANKAILSEKRALLDRFEITGLLERSTGVLSGGEKRRLSLASALITSPRIIFFDEPFTELDYSGICEFLLLLEELKKSGVTIVLVTHDLTKVLSLATRVIILNDGTAAFDGLPREILEGDRNLGIRIPQASPEMCTWLP